MVSKQYIGTSQKTQRFLLGKLNCYSYLSVTFLGSVTLDKGGNRGTEVAWCADSFLQMVDE